MAKSIYIIQSFTPHTQPFLFDKETGEKENHKMDCNENERNFDWNSQRKSEIEFQ